MSATPLKLTTRVAMLMPTARTSVSCFSRYSGNGRHVASAETQTQLRWRAPASQRHQRADFVRTETSAPLGQVLRSAVVG